MASTAGLTRRRGGGGGGSNGGDEERSGSPSIRPSPSESRGGGETSYTTENGHKIGENTKDLTAAATSLHAPPPRLTWPSSEDSIRPERHQRESGEEQAAKANADGGDPTPGIEG